MQILDPTNPRAGRRNAVPTVNLAGARLAFLNNGWRSMTAIGEFIAGPLKADHRVAEIICYDVPRNREPPDSLLDRVAREFDAAIVGMAN